MERFLVKAGLLKEDPNKAAPQFVNQAPANAAPVQPQFGTPQQAATYVPNFAAPVVGIDPDIRATLVKTMEGQRLGGFDYLKFVETLEGMKAAIPLDAQRYSVAYGVAKSMNADKAQLIDGGKHYVQVLQQASTDFNASVARRTDETVVAGENKIVEIDKLIGSKAEQIQKLSQEIEAAQQERAALVASVSENRVKLEVRKKSFEVTHAACVAEIEENINKIMQFVQ